MTGKFIKKKGTHTMEHIYYLYSQLSITTDAATINNVGLLLATRLW